jgi:hypothetical protein
MSSGAGPVERRGSKNVVSSVRCRVASTKVQVVVDTVDFDGLVADAASAASPAPATVTVIAPIMTAATTSRARGGSVCTVGR